MTGIGQGAPDTVNFIHMKRYVFIGLGFLNVGLGTIGMFLPIMPTTVFLLMAAWLFSKSSPRFQQWLESNKFFGSYICNYRSGRGMEVRDKVLTLITLWVGLGISSFFVSALWIHLLLLTVGVGVTIHILTIRTWRPNGVVDQDKMQTVPE